MSHHPPPSSAAPRSEPAATLLADPAVAHAVRLSGLLQTSLNVQTVLQLFLDSLAAAVPHAGAEFAPPEGAAVSFGRRTAHPLPCVLQLGGECLGELRLFGRKPFSDAQTEQIHGLLTPLLYPLRNTLLYQRALAAAYVDALTGVRNRAAMDEALSREVELARRHGNPLSLLVLDLDRFKHINDAHGHAVGDAVLRDLARLLQRCIRGCDLLFRFGGEEFTVLLSNTPARGARRLGERLCEAVRSAPWHVHDLDLALTTSIGVATLRAGQDAAQLFHEADRALYVAKRTGRARVCSAPASRGRASEA